VTVLVWKTVIEVSLIRGVATPAPAVSASQTAYDPTERPEWFEEQNGERQRLHNDPADGSFWMHVANGATRDGIRAGSRGQDEPTVSRWSNRRLNSRGR
jgi:hypothetical protein